MNLRDWYFGQIVTQSQMDEAFEWAQDADRNLAKDLELTGICYGAEMGQTAPASMNVAVKAPGVVYDKTGARVYISSAPFEVDCSVDEYGVSTAVVGAGNERWVSIFIRAARTESDPAVDGNGLLVNTRQWESYEVYVRQGVEATIGAATRPTLDSEAVLLCDVHLVYLQSTILAADISITRSEFWLNKLTTSFGRQLATSPLDAIDNLWDTVDSLGATGAAYTPGQTWFSSVALAGPTPPVTTVIEGLDAVIYDLKQATGSARIGTANSALTYCSWASQSVNGALQAIATAVNSHVSGSAPYHPATAVAVTPYSWIAATTVQAALQEIVDDLGSTTGSASGDLRVGCDAQTILGRVTWTAGTLRARLTVLMALVEASAAAYGDKLMGTLFAVPNNRGDSGSGNAVEQWLAKCYGSNSASTTGVPLGGIHGWTEGNGHGGTSGQDLSCVCPVLVGANTYDRSPAFLAVGPGLGNVVLLCNHAPGSIDAIGTSYRKTLSGMAATNSIYACCPDNTVSGRGGAFLLGTKTGSSQAYVWRVDLSDTTPTLVTTGGWTASGVALTGCALSAAYPSINRLIPAGTYLVAVCGGEDHTGTPICSLEIASPTTQLAGKGNGDSSFDRVTAACLCPWYAGDYDKIAFVTYDAVNPKLCFADVKDPSDATPARNGSSNLTPYTLATLTNQVYELVWDGAFLWLMDVNGNVGLFSPYVAFNGSDQAHALNETILMNSLAHAGKLHKMLFDGLDMNFIVLVDDTASASILLHMAVPARTANFMLNSPVDIGAAGMSWAMKGILNVPISLSTGQTITDPGPAAVGFNTLVYAPDAGTHGLQYVYPLHH